LPREREKGPVGTPQDIAQGCVEVPVLSFLVVFRRLSPGLRRGRTEPQFRGLLYLAVILLLAGMFFCHRVEG
ncbi:MAG: hypothetical protein ABIJ48_13100, partial [Actinomycetota bacterium]